MWIGKSLRMIPMRRALPKGPLFPVHFCNNTSYSGGKKNPGLSIKTSGNVHTTHKHCKR